MGLQCGQGNSLEETTREQGESAEYQDADKKKKDQLRGGGQNQGRLLGGGET